VASELARLIPDAVLHNIMPIFTFMSASDLQRDDAYSFGVVEKVCYLKTSRGSTDLVDRFEDRACHDQIPSRQSTYQAGIIQRSITSHVWENQADD
jgi:hypothetical protein